MLLDINKLLLKTGNGALDAFEIADEDCDDPGGGGAFLAGTKESSGFLFVDVVEVGCDMDDEPGGAGAFLEGNKFGFGAIEGGMIPLALLLLFNELFFNWFCSICC